MNIADFINNRVKTKVDFDGAYGAQCVDLFRQYCNDVLKIPHTGAVVGAKDLFLNYKKLPKEKEFFSQVTSKFKLGDVVVWDESRSNKYGHVAIFVASYSEEKILVLEQDGFAQTGTRFVIRDTKNLLGALRFKAKEK